MFTGIIEDVGIVENFSSSKLIISTKLTDIKIGDSVSVNGVCLTVTKIQDNLLDFDYSPTTSNITNISLLHKNSNVNLERALTLNTRLGGHILSGHIDTTTKILNITKLNNFYEIVFDINDVMKKYIVNKGFVAIDGISLTIAKLNENNFSVTMIPETFTKTIFSTRKINDIVNIEIDVFAKYIEKMFKAKKESNISVDFLKENGFF